MNRIRKLHPSTQIISQHASPEYDETGHGHHGDDEEDREEEVQQVRKHQDQGA